MFTSDQPMRVGVTGSSGYVGRALVARLARGGHEVVAFTRHGTLAGTPAARVIVGDIRDVTPLAEFAAATDAVIHAAAYVHRAADTPAARAECRAVNETATRSLVATLEATGRKPHLVFVSSTAVYGSTVSGASESAVTHPVTAYGESKLAAERAVLDAASRGTITACVLRPAVVIGRGAPGNTERLLRLVRRGWVPRVRGAANHKSFVHVDDLAEAAVRATEQPERVNLRTYNVAGEPATVEQLVQSLARGAGLSVRWLPVPSWTIAMATSGARTVSALSGGAIPDFSRLLDAFAGEATVDSSAIARELGVAFRTTGEALSDMASAVPA